jgi:hypothetical protein
MHDRRRTHQLIHTGVSLPPHLLESLLCLVHGAFVPPRHCAAHVPYGSKPSHLVLHCGRAVEQIRLVCTQPLGVEGEGRLERGELGGELVVYTGVQGEELGVGRSSGGRGRTTMSMCLLMLVLILVLVLV